MKGEEFPEELVRRGLKCVRQKQGLTGIGGHSRCETFKKEDGGPVM